jgi:type I restriction enzyme S subunit
MHKLLTGIEIEWKSLWEVTTWDKRFNSINKVKQPNVIKYPYLLASQLFKLEKDSGNVFLLSTGERTGWTTEDVAAEYLCEGEVVTIPWGKSRPVKDVLKYYNGKFVTADNRIATSNDTNVLLNKFLYYWMQNQSSVIDRFYRGSGIKHPSMANVLDMKIPIPPVEIQKEIIRILDSLAEYTKNLTAELKVELNARKQQYRYYREQLFCFEESEVDWKSLIEIGEFQRGKRFVKTDLVSEGVPTIHYGEMYTHYGTWADETKSFVSKKLVNDKKLRIAKKGDVVIVAAGETIDDIGMGTAWLGNEGVVIHDACFSFRSSLNPKYLAYFTRTKQFHDQIRGHISSGKISSINSKGLSKVIIPVPSEKEQERVVSILDKFDILTTSISESLPNEMALRLKQYEYYSDMLLTFPMDNTEE